MILIIKSDRSVRPRQRLTIDWNGEQYSVELVSNNTRLPGRDDGTTAEKLNSGSIPATNIFRNFRKMKNIVQKCNNWRIFIEFCTVFNI